MNIFSRIVPAVLLKWLCAGAAGHLRPSSSLPPVHLLSTIPTPTFHPLLAASTDGSRCTLENSLDAKGPKPNGKPLDQQYLRHPPHYAYATQVSAAAVAPLSIRSAADGVKYVAPKKNASEDPGWYCELCDEHGGYRRDIKRHLYSDKHRKNDPYVKLQPSF
ncbi:hypothetical protein EIP91_007032 [Steccherinum ochraceum]|uniref:U1-type domain-containing protein n=1 Tax=Steccherinum ochraceum TaxID=92696 RepID=A0A4R0RUZ1_9APHY|nr:hypothetical protein EIP91_007032 [Steccherinum ochraceum]